MRSLPVDLARLSYLELLATGTPAAAFAAAAQLLAGGTTAWVLAPRLASVPALNPDALLVCAPSVKEAYWAGEQALRSGAVEGVILVLDRPYSLTQSRRFKLATEAKGTHLIVVLPGSVPAFASAAKERWHLVPDISQAPDQACSTWQQLKNRAGALVRVRVGQAPDSPRCG